MKEHRTAISSITINASPESIWQALIDPEKIKSYLFGTEAVSEWTVGSKIYYRGIWEGRPYEDKGEILEMDTCRRLVMTYWSSFSGLPDVPENYHRITYLLQELPEGTKLTVMQENHHDLAARDHSEKQWQAVLYQMRKIVEQ